MPVAQRFLFVLATAALAPVLQGQSAVLVSADPSGTAGNGVSYLGSWTPNVAQYRGACVSSDGRFAAFFSEATNLVSGSSSSHQVYVRDVLFGTTVVGSTDSAGQPGSGVSVLPQLSGRGRYLAFASSSSNLVPNDTNFLNGGGWDVFVKDLVTGAIERVSVSSSGTQAVGSSGWRGGQLSNHVKPAGVALSRDGRFVAFASDASNLVANDTHLGSDVFVHDRKTNQTSLVSALDPSVPPPPLSGPTGSAGPMISDDGRWVAFGSSVTTLVPNDTNHAIDVFVSDMQLGITVRANVDSSGNQANDWGSLAGFSADGRFVLFNSPATNLVSSTSTTWNMYVHDMLTGVTTLESLDAVGLPAIGDGHGADLSADGRYILFQSSDPNLVPNDTNGSTDAFIRDRLLGTIRRVGVGAGGTEADLGTSPLQLARNGRVALIVTEATTLSPLDANGFLDVYLTY